MMAWNRVSAALLPLATAFIALGCAGSRPPASAVTAAPPANAAALPPGSKCRRPRPDDGGCRKGYRLVCDEGIGILRCDKLPEE